jgi:(p)ppGpp synthase/HD superfamily hydrolase
MTDFGISGVENLSVLLPECCIKLPNRNLLKTMYICFNKTTVHQRRCERIRNAYVSKTY